jgi:multisubunit Na+/H+ antiporter MnhF subunit
VTGFVAASIAMVACLAPLAVVLWRGRLIEAVMALQVLGVVVVMVLVMLSQAFGRPGEFELAVVLAALSLGSGLVFLRALERWL